MIRDRSVDPQRRVYRIPYQLFGLEPSHQHTYSASPTNSAEGLVGMDTNAPTINEISTFGFGGVEINATTDAITTLDLISPTLFDPSEPIGVRCWFTANVAVPGATDAIRFTVTYKQVDPDEQFAAASTALDTTIATTTPGDITGYRLLATSRGIINAAKFDYTSKKGGIIWTVTCSTFTNYTAKEPVFLALELDYMPLEFAHPEVSRDFWANQAASS